MSLEKVHFNKITSSSTELINGPPIINDIIVAISLEGTRLLHRSKREVGTIFVVSLSPKKTCVDYFYKITLPNVWD